MAGGSVCKDFIAASAVTAFRAVYVDADGKVAHATDPTQAGGEAYVGIAQRDASAGNSVAVAVSGISRAQIGGALTSGTDDLLMVGALGKLVAHDGTGTKKAAASFVPQRDGLTGDADGAASDLVWVKVLPDGSLASAQIAALEDYAVKASLTAADEAADVIAVTVAMQDMAGNAFAGAVDLLCEVRTATGIVALDTAYTIAETGGGTEVTGTGEPSILVTTSAAGAAELSVTDVVGGSDATVYLFVQPMGGLPSRIALTFDNA